MIPELLRQLLPDNYPNDPNKDPGILIEVKMGPSAKAGLEQIEQKAYYQELKTHGCTRINAYCIAFDGKNVTLETKLPSP